MQISVRLGRKAGVHSLAVFIGFLILINDILNKVRRGRCIRNTHSSGSFGCCIDSQIFVANCRFPAHSVISSNIQYFYPICRQINMKNSLSRQNLTPKLPHAIK